MSALVGPRGTQRRIGEHQSDPVAAATKIFRGAAVCLDSAGNAVNASGTTGLISRGIARDTKDNSAGLAGDLRIDSDEGVFEFFNKSGDELSQDEVLDVCYWSDNQTVCKTSTGKSVAGIVKSVDANTGRVSVEIGPWPVQVGLLAANNLSDVSSAATARANLASNKIMLSFEGISSKGSDAEVVRWVAPFACSISNFYTVLNAALATGDATVQAKKNGSNIGSTTTGLATITQSGSAAGDVDTAAPLTTNLALAAGDILSFVVAGASTATATLNLSALLTY